MPEARRPLGPEALRANPPWRAEWDRRDQAPRRECRAGPRPAQSGEARKMRSFRGPRPSAPEARGLEATAETSPPEHRKPRGNRRRRQTDRPRETAVGLK